MYGNISSVVEFKKMVVPQKQGLCPKIIMVKGKLDTNYFEPLMIFRS